MMPGMMTKTRTTRKRQNKMMSLTRCVFSLTFGFPQPSPFHITKCIHSQVDAFLEAHETGVTDADREVAKG